MAWIEIKNGLIATLISRGSPSTLGDWREVVDDPRYYKLVNDELVSKTQFEIDEIQVMRTNRDTANRQRIGAKVQTAIVSAVNGSNLIPLRNLLTKIVMKFQDLEDEIT